MTSAHGTITSCGPGQGFSLDFTCTGPSCVSLNNFPGTTCTQNNDELHCSNGVTCPGTTNYTSTFDFTQDTKGVSQTQKILLKDWCEEIDLVSDGSTGGTKATYVSTGDCGPQNGSNSTTSTSTSSMSSSSTTKNSSMTSMTGSTTSSLLTTTAASPYSSSEWGQWSNWGSEKQTHNPSQTSSPVMPSSSNEPSSTTNGGWEGLSYFPQESSSFIPWSTTSESDYITTSGSVPEAQSSSATYNLPNTTPETTTNVVTYPDQSSAITAQTYDAASTGSAGQSVPIVTSPSMTTSGSASNTTQPWATYTNSGNSNRRISPSHFWTSMIIMFTILIQGTWGLADSPTNPAPAGPLLIARELSARHDTVPVPVANLSITDLHELSSRQLSAKWQDFAKLLAEYISGKITNGGEYADNLVAEIESAVCDHASNVVVSAAVEKIVGADLTEACIAAIYTGNALVAPELEFLSVLGAGILCNLLVAEALPAVTGLTDALANICKQPKPCSKDMLTDPNNCGACGKKCETGICANGACTSNTCTGRTCGTFLPCGPGGSCVCASTAEATGFCVDGTTPCAGLADCSTSAECGSGEVCAINSCCTRNVCVGASVCGGASAGDDNSATSPAALMLLRRTWENSTIASLGMWV